MGTREGCFCTSCVKNRRIAALEATERELREALKVLAVAIKPLVGVTDEAQ